MTDLIVSALTEPLTWRAMTGTERAAVCVVAMAVFSLVFSASVLL